MPDQSVDKPGKYLKWILGILSILAVIASMAITWGVTRNQLDTLQKEFKEYKKETKGQVADLRSDLTEIQIRQAGADQTLKNIQEDVAEIKTDVKKLIGVR